MYRSRAAHRRNRFHAFPYFLALEQDYEQMERQQWGLRDSTLTELALTRQEVRLAHFHAALDSWIESGERG